MAHSSASSSSSRRARVKGDYILGRQIGSGSFSVVWHARHRIHGTEVAVKEIVTERLNERLQNSLRSEVDILKGINHPNIIALYDVIEEPGRVYLVLEYCRAGDLSMYIQRHGRVPEATAKHFMQQLATGLQVLRECNTIHRDLKPQNLLLSSNDANSVLKIADFGFAKDLKTRGLAETVCGSPLYMAPEIMQQQNYDAKADLWSVGAILFQLVTGKTPFTGNNQVQLQQNIAKSKDLRFPTDNNNLSCECIDLCRRLLRRNPVERLSFEEFFNHQFLSQKSSDKSMSPTSSRRKDGFPLVECSLVRPSRGSSQEGCLPSHLDVVSSGHDGSPSVPMKKASMRSTYGFSVDNIVNKSPACSPSNNIDTLSKYSSTHKLEIADSRPDYHRPPDGNTKECKLVLEQRPLMASSKDSTVVDSLEFIDQDYVLVSGPFLEVSSSSASAFRSCNSSSRSESSPPQISALSAPMPIIGAAISNTHAIGSMESHSPPPSGTSRGSTDMGDAMEQPSAHCMMRIRSLHQCASAVTELVNEKIENGRRLEAFSLQLVSLAIWRQAMDICRAQSASAIEGSPSQEVTTRGGNQNYVTNTPESVSSISSQQLGSVSSQIKGKFLLEVGHADELTSDLGPVDEATEMPDAMDIIFQYALALGRHGAVNELMGNREGAINLYSKAVQLLYFLLVEAPSLILNPPFSLTNSDRFRLRSYINILNNRQAQTRSQNMALLDCGDQQSPQKQPL